MARMTPAAGDGTGQLVVRVRVCVCLRVCVWVGGCSHAWTDGAL